MRFHADDLNPFENERLLHGILIVGPSWVGDMMMAQSLFKLLKQQDPSCIIDVLAPEWSLPLIERMPEVRRGVVMPIGHRELKLAERKRIGQELGRIGYERAIVLPNSFKSALIPAFAGIPTRTGYRREMRYFLVNDLRMLSRYRMPMTVQRFVALGLPVNAPLPDPLPRPQLSANAENQARLREELGLPAQRRAVAFMPGAEYGPAKQWPLEHFGAVAQELVARGLDVWIIGSAKDVEAGEQIAQMAGEGVKNLAGKTSLGDAVDLLAMAEGAVTNDSGLMHVAAALDVPLVAIFGSSTPEHTPPLALPERVAVLYLGIKCSPCFERTCKYQHLRCLTEISPASVIQALDGLGVGAGAGAGIGVEADASRPAS